MRKLILLCTVAAIGVILVLSLLLTPLGSLLTGNNTSSSISQEQSGLVAYDSLSQSSQNQTLHFTGDAATRDASYTVFENSTYLHIGVAAPSSGSWAGYYAVTSDTYATLAHARLAAPSGTIQGYFTNGLYVQSSAQVLNYITCASITNTTGTFWVVVHGHNPGLSASSATSYDYLWRDSGSAQPLIRDCTIVTNGQNLLKVYLDNNLVYSSDTLSLGMPQPFNFFVGVETAYAGQVTFGASQDFYVTLSDNVKVVNLPAKAAMVNIVSPQGAIIASAPARSGTAYLSVGQDLFPFKGYIRAYSSTTDTSNASLVASTAGTMAIAGGDVYSTGTNPSTTSQLNIDSRDGNGNELNGYYTALTQNGNVVATDYLPTTFTLNNGQTYTLQVSDYGNYVFDHWSDGSISRIRTIAISNNTDIAAIFRNIHDPVPSGHSIISVTAQDSQGRPITGFYATLWENGFLVASAYSPATFVVDNYQSYQVSMSSYSGYTFSKWSDGSTNTFDTLYAAGGTVDTDTAIYNANYSG